MEELSLKGVFSLELVKKERFTGSYHGMRYMLRMEDGRLAASVYPEPYCWEATPEEKKQTAFFAFSQEGLQEMTEWLNRQYLIFVT